MEKRFNDINEISVESIIKACHEVQKRGWKISGGAWMKVSTREMCPLAAFALRNFPKEVVKMREECFDIQSALLSAAEMKLGCSSVKNFVHSIDNDHGEKDIQIFLREAVEKAFENSFGKEVRMEK